MEIPCRIITNGTNLLRHQNARHSFLLVGQCDLAIELSAWHWLIEKWLNSVPDCCLLRIVGVTMCISTYSKVRCMTAVHNAGRRSPISVWSNSRSDCVCPLSIRLLVSLCSPWDQLLDSTIPYLERVLSPLYDCVTAKQSRQQGNH